MPRFERSREGRSDSRESSPRRGSRDRRSFDDRPPSRGGSRGGRRDSGRDSGGFGRERREVTMTRVTCSSCGAKCEVPFKPTSSKPVYCEDCFSKTSKNGSSRSSDSGSTRDLDIINEKLNKIMKALNIE